ncbi:hypothetical protein WN943_007086 [Citrus x changshan-huyou]
MQLELKYAAEINSLVPPHQYVPWIVVDVQPLYEDYEIFIDYICMAYKGNLVPKTCGNLFLITNNITHKNLISITMWIRKIGMVASL